MSDISFTFTLQQVVAASVAAAKEEIRALTARGDVSANCMTFATLHDYVDANMLGGGDFLAILFGPDADIVVETMQQQVDEWLRAGRP